MIIFLFYLWDKRKFAPLIFTHADIHSTDVNAIISAFKIMKIERTLGTTVLFSYVCRILT